MSLNRKKKKKIVYDRENTSHQTYPRKVILIFLLKLSKSEKLTNT